MLQSNELLNKNDLASLSSCVTSIKTIYHSCFNPDTKNELSEYTAADFCSYFIKLYEAIVTILQTKNPDKDYIQKNIAPAYVQVFNENEINLTQYAPSTPFFEELSTFIHNLKNIREMASENSENVAPEEKANVTPLQNLIKNISQGNDTLINSFLLIPSFRKLALIQGVNEGELSKEETLDAIISYVVENKGFKFEGDCFLYINSKSNSENSILTHWETVREAYQTSNTAEQKIKFLNTIIEFKRKIKQLFNSDYERSIVNAISNYVAANGMKINPIEQDFLTQMNREVSIVTNKSSEKSDEILNKIAMLFNFAEIKEEAPSTILTTLIKEEITLVSSALVIFCRIAFPSETSEELERMSYELIEDIENYTYLPLVLEQDQLFMDSVKNSKLGIITHIQLNDIDKNVSEELRNDKASLLSCLGELKALERYSLQNNGHLEMERRPLTEQAAFKYKVNKAQFKLSEEEMDILNELTKISISTLIPINNPSKKYPDGTFSYKQYIDLINQKIQAIKQENTKGNKLFPKRTDHLELAKMYVAYHFNQYINTVNPEMRLNPEHRILKEPAPIGRHRNLVSCEEQRNQFFKAVDKLTYFGANIQLKKLKTMLEQKRQLAHKLKEKASLLQKAQKVFRSQEIFDNLSTCNKGNRGGYLFLPSSLEVTGKFLHDGIPSDGIKLFSDLDQINSFLNGLQKIKEDTLILNGDSTLQVRYDDNIANSLKSQDINEQRTKINSIWPPEKPFNTQASKEEKQIFINTVGLTINLVNHLSTLIRTKIVNLPISGYKDYLKSTLRTKHQELIATTKSPEGFLCAEEYALNKVGIMLNTAKTTKKQMKSIASKYLMALDLEMQARTEVIKIINDMHKMGAISKDKIEAKIKEIKSHSLINYQTENSEHSSYTIGNTKNLEICAGLNHFLEIIIKTPKEITSANIDEYGKQIENLRTERMLATGKVKLLLTSAKEMLDTFTYLADHTTLLLNGQRKLN